VDASLQQVAEEIIHAVLDGRVRSKDDLQRIKRRLCRRYHLPRFPSDVEILSFASEEQRQLISKVLRKKPTRTLSGVAIVAVMTKPMSCPGNCIYCPTNIPTAPKAYIGEEPATLRARQNQYDPFLQITSRLQQLQAMGHSINKVELIIMGGTFPSAPLTYQREFMKRCLDAMNGRDAPNLPKAIKWAEKSPIRPVGTTIETRPDYCFTTHIDNMLALGTTRVEIGVQTIYDDIYERIKRGHTVADVIFATKAARDAGLKICYHIMPGLPGSTPERDFQMVKTLFQSEQFQPDMLKIYPCLVLSGTELFELWRRGEYEPYTTEQIVDALAEILPHIPRWVRIQRMQRDIPSRLIIAGPTAGNLTQLVFKRAEARGYSIHTIRYREAGYKQRTSTSSEPTAIELDALNLRVDKYDAADGTELFLSYEDSVADSLIGYLRLRIPSDEAHRPEIHNQNAALLRELHVFGSVVDLGEKTEEDWQHHGLGNRLLDAAEEYARDWGCKKIVCTSGIGVRQYYLHNGYQYDGPYCSKNL
jgi:elongator complex protein 3